MQTNQTEQDLSLPNVYFVTVSSAITGETHHLYIPADFSGSAFRKAQNICAERFHFRPFRSNSTVKMRRLKLSDYLENPDALRAALVTAAELGERDTLLALRRRPQEIAAMLSVAEQPVIDFDAVLGRLKEQLSTLDSLPAKEAV